MNHTSYEKQLEDTVVGLESKIDELVKENSKLSDENKKLKKFERYFNNEIDKQSDNGDRHPASFRLKPLKAAILSATASLSWIAFFVGLAISVSGLPATGIMTMIVSLCFFIASIQTRSDA